MKKAYLLALTMLLSIGMFGQKNVNVDNLRFYFAVRELPTKAFDPPFFYYASKITLASTVKACVDENALYEALKIEGQRVTDNPTDKDLILDVNMGTLNISGSDVKERMVEVKDKDGKVTNRVYYYWVETVYTFDATAALTRGEEVIGKYTMYSRNRTQLYKSNEYNTRKAAADHWNNNRDVLRDQFTREVATNAISQLADALTKEYGYRSTKYAGLIKTINEKKHPENDALREMSETLKSRMVGLNASTPLSESDMADVIEYFKGIPQRYTDAKLKADVRLRYVAYYNLCRVYMYINQPEKVKEWADLLFQNGHDKKDAERLIKDAADVVARFNKSDIKTMQFDPESYFK